MRVPHRIDPVTVRKGDIITPNISIHVVTSQYLLHFPAAGHRHGGHTLVDSFVARRWQFVERPRGPICVGVPLIMIGAAGLLWCIWQFFSEGRWRQLMRRNSWWSEASIDMFATRCMYRLRRS